MSLTRRSLLIAAAGTASATVLTACGGGDDDPVDNTPIAVGPPNIVELARSNSDLRVLVEAIESADLGVTLSGPGPFTVFAPTNAAFVRLLGDLNLTQENLFNDKALLTSVLTYHVVPGRVAAADIPFGRAITTVQGGVFKIEPTGGSDNRPAITDGRNRVSTITTTDLQASNGIVHVIDEVLLPPNRTVVETIADNADLSLLSAAITAAGLGTALNAAGPFTVFAPTNTAFAALLTELGITQDALFADTALLTQVLRYHVVNGRVLRADVPLNTPIATLQGGTFSVNEALVITDARTRTANIAQADVLASNGAVHVINRVLLPAA